MESKFYECLKQQGIDEIGISYFISPDKSSANNIIKAHIAGL